MARITFFLSTLIIMVCLSVVPGFSQQKETRAALVIGNSNYSALGKLANPGNDATDMTETLKALRFSVTLLIDADLRSMEQGIVRFGNALSTSQSSIGFFSMPAMECSPTESTTSFLPTRKSPAKRS